MYFKILISFHKLIESLEEIANSDIDYRSNYAKSLLKEIENKPEFRDGIEDLAVIYENESLIKNLLADLFKRFQFSSGLNNIMFSSLSL